MKFLNLAAFRKANGIKQEDLAVFLNTSRSFLSLIETGRSPFPPYKIDRIMEEGRKLKGWDVSILNPQYYRLYELCTELSNSSDEKDDKAFDWSSGKSILNIIPQDMLDIKHGKKTITSEIADSVAHQYPNVNTEWLIYGNGSMFKNGSERETDRNRYSALEQEVREMKKELKQMSDTISKIWEAIGKKR